MSNHCVNSKYKFNKLRECFGNRPLRSQRGTNEVNIFSVKVTKWTSFEKDRDDWRDTKWASFKENSDDWTPGIGQTLLVESFWLEDS